MEGWNAHVMQIYLEKEKEKEKTQNAPRVWTST